MMQVALLACDGVAALVLAPNRGNTPARVSFVLSAYHKLETRTVLLQTIYTHPNEAMFVPKAH